MNFRNGKKLTSFQVIVYGFALVILTGSLFSDASDGDKRRAGGLVFGCNLYINIGGVCNRVGST